ncbi:uncharacterized protein LOC106092592 [Stomoxys calcitrans]|uniref:Uncharacterized protein n=1 Tax=Stomoxys calcitrans TaxID=35570 RepID=A0A1I8P6S6_STOCA|nr:uncharacterized protein LOC106092592 [Stomoxys calcitrans]
MMSRTVRYFKMFYIVAGILLSNEDICHTVDAMHISPRVEVMEKLQKQTARKVQQPAIEDKAMPAKKVKTWLPRLSFSTMMDRIKNRMRPQWPAINLWAFPNYVIEYSTNLLCRKFIINSDCDVIYK